MQQDRVHIKDIIIFGPEDQTTAFFFPGINILLIKKRLPG